jgi:hypothetical protein
MKGASQATGLSSPTEPCSTVSALTGFDPSRWRSCPFDGRLARTPYLVLPKLAIQVMSIEWREALEALLVEMEDCGLETPVYEVVPKGGEIRQRMCCDKDDWRCGEVVPVPSIDDPWADYRHNQIAKVEALCPRFDPALATETRRAETTGSVEDEGAGPKDNANTPSQPSNGDEE